MAETWPRAPAGAAGRAAATARPWCEAWLERAPSPVWAAGLGITLAVCLAMLAVEVASGELGRTLRGEAAAYKASEYRFSFVFALLAGYLPCAWWWTVHASREAFAGLRPVLRGSPAELDALAAGLGRFERRALRRAGLLGVGVALALPVLIDQSAEVYAIGELNTAAASHRLLVPVICWLFARLSYAWVSDALRLVEISRERLQMDVLDLGPVAPLARCGLRNALVALGCVSILSLMLVDWASRPGLPWVLGALFPVAIGLGALGLLLPLRGARMALQRAKQRELDWVHGRIRARRSQLEAGAGREPGAGASLDELVAYRQLVAEARTWPFDGGIWLRFALYLAIPLGSWLGGALVEQGVSRLLE